MQKDFLTEYLAAESFYENKLSDLRGLKFLVKTNLGKKYAADAEIYNIRGTRYFLVLQKYFLLTVLGEYVSIRFNWFLKHKNKKEYKKIDFEEVLDSNLISDSAKEELVFNLNVFLTLS